MNCKPGDLARVISIPATREAGVVDWMFKLTHLDGMSNNGKNPCWAYEGPMRREPQGPNAGRLIEAVADYVLRPIGNPGDDAVDEMVRRVPLPIPEIIPAMLDKETA